MKKLISAILLLALVFGILSGCIPQGAPATTEAEPSAVTTEPTTKPTTEPAVTPTTEPTTEPSTASTTEPTVEPSTTSTTEPTTATATEPTAPEHSALYLPYLPVEDVIRYFNEVCLNAEFVNAGDPTKLQKWVVPIRYYIHGTYTEEDMSTLNQFVSWLNQIDGFPGMHMVDDPVIANLNIHFCGPEDYFAVMGDQFYGTDGGITFWYNGANQIYDAIIGYRTDLDQITRNSVILEEIYNGLGPINDTWERKTSIIYGGYSIPQWLSEEDQLILKLLYHPSMQCGMNTSQCEDVIRQLYY